MENLIYLAPIAGIIAVIFAGIKAAMINKSDAGNEKMKEISSAIAEGAKAFLFSEYKILIVFVAVLFVVLGFGIDWLTAVCFIVGAVLSTLAGYVGMNVATKAKCSYSKCCKGKWYEQGTFNCILRWCSNGTLRCRFWYFRT